MTNEKTSVVTENAATGNKSGSTGVSRLIAALEYIMMLVEKKNPHLGRPRLSDEECIFCAAFFAVNNGAYGYHISENDYKALKEKLLSG